MRARRLYHLVKSELLYDLQDYHNEMVAIGAACKWFHSSLLEIVDSANKDGPVRATAAMRLTIWNETNGERIAKVPFRVHAWMAARECINLANAQFLKPLVHDNGVSTTFHQHILKCADWGRRKSGPLFQLLASHPIGDTANPTRGRRENVKWVTIPEAAQWKRVCEEALNGFVDFEPRSWELLKSSLEIEHWRSIEYLVRNRELFFVDVTPKKVIAVSPESPAFAAPESLEQTHPNEQRDKLFVELWKKHKRKHRKAMNEYNETHYGEDAIGYSAFKTAVSRYVKRHPDTVT